MITAIFDLLWMVIGLVIDILTLPIRIVVALLSGARFEFRRFGRRRGSVGATR